MKHHLIKKLIEKIKTNNAHSDSWEDPDERSVADSPAQAAALEEAAKAPEIAAKKRQEQRQKEQRLIKDALAGKNAPQGDPASDLKTALYLVCALYHPQFRGVASLGVIQGLLGRLGYTREAPETGESEYLKILGNLVSDGALAKMPGYQVYAMPSQVSSGEAKVSAREETDFPGDDRNKHFVFHVTGNNGEDLLLKSPIVIMPGDSVQYQTIVNTGIAYVEKLTKKRVFVLGRVMPLRSSGTSSSEGRVATLMPDEPNLANLGFVFETAQDLGEARAGDVVIAEILERGSGRSFVKTRQVVKDLGNLNNIIVMAVLRNDIPSSWPENMPKALARIPDSVSASDWTGRPDIREIPLMTIDGEDARDFDDAVFAKKSGKGWKLYVAIADVSYYVRPGSVLDHEAVNRCNSCYFPNYVIPMLPEKLSNGICSLNPDVDRLCMCCEMDINQRGETTGYVFYPAVMRSHARLTYNEAWQMISEGTARYPEHEVMIPHVKELYNLYHALDAYRKRRGGISIESTEQHFVFNENMEITGVEPLERNDAHKLIEECMIAANVAAARFVSENRSQTLYRVHAAPTQKKLDMLLPQLARFGLTLTGGEKPTSADYAKLADSIAKRKDGKILGELLLRSMSKAEYSPDNIGHFGLALEKYAHFTSPIRRYADLQLHRVIKHILEKQGKATWGKIGQRSYTKPELLTLGARCTEREISADMAEREVDFELACVYLEKFIGETVKGTISGCTRFGVFVHLDDFLVDGLIFIGNFPGYLNFDQRTESLISDKGKVYRIGDPIKVVVAAVNAAEHKIDLMPTGLGSTAKYRKDRERILKKREADRAADKGAVDKEALFKSLSDISRAKEASEGDNVERPQVPAGWGSELTSSEHYANPFAMPSRRGYEKRDFRKGRGRGKSKGKRR